MKCLRKSTLKIKICQVSEPRSTQTHAKHPDFLMHHSPGTLCLAEGLMNCFLALTLISKLLHCHPEMQLQATTTVLRPFFHPACVHNASGAHSDGHETY